MAWQSPSAMNTGSAGGGGDGSAPAGTEYTLQGKMVPWIARQAAAVSNDQVLT
jgi:hypothetical protein